MIAISPPPDGREWEAQCARCGSSVAPAEAMTFDEEDPVYTALVCTSSFPWCEAHPLEGRSGVQRGELEWFPVAREARA